MLRVEAWISIVRDFAVLEAGDDAASLGEARAEPTEPIGEAMAGESDLRVPALLERRAADPDSRSAGIVAEKLRPNPFGAGPSVGAAGLVGAGGAAAAIGPLRTECFCADIATVDRSPARAGMKPRVGGPGTG